MEHAHIQVMLAVLARLISLAGSLVPVDAGDVIIPLTPAGYVKWDQVLISYPMVFVFAIRASIQFASRLLSGFRCRCCSPLSECESLARQLDRRNARSERDRDPYRKAAEITIAGDQR